MGLSAILGLGAAGIGAAGSIISSGNAKDAANKASDTQLQMYQQTRKDLAPFASTGSAAMSQLANIFGFGPGGTGQPNAAAATSQLTQFPGYQFGRDQGVQALDRSAASRGLLLSGAQLKDTQQFGTQYAMQQAWQPYVSGLQWAANLGENAAAGTGQVGATAAAGAAQAQLAAGQASANGVAGVTNQLQSGLQAYQLQHGGGGAATNTSGFNVANYGDTGPNGESLWGLY